MPTPGKAVSPPIEVMLTMWPARRRRICGRTAWITATAPKTLTSNWARICAGVASSIAPSKPYPALLTSTSTPPPVRSSASPMPRRTLASSVTSSRMPSARPGASVSNSALAAAFRTVPATRSPFARTASAKARPKPLLTPVINQFAMSHLLVSLSPSYCRLLVVRCAGSDFNGLADFNRVTVALTTFRWRWACTSVRPLDGARLTRATAFERIGDDPRAGLGGRHLSRPRPFTRDGASLGVRDLCPPRRRFLDRRRRRDGAVIARRFDRPHEGADLVPGIGGADLAALLEEAGARRRDRFLPPAVVLNEVLGRADQGLALGYGVMVIHARLANVQFIDTAKNAHRRAAMR